MRESKRHLFEVDSLDKQMQNEKEPIRLASAKGGGGLFFICLESINLTYLSLPRCSKIVRIILTNRMGKPF